MGSGWRSGESAPGPRTIRPRDRAPPFLLLPPQLVDSPLYTDAKAAPLGDKLGGLFVGFFEAHKGGMKGHYDAGSGAAREAACISADGSPREITLIPGSSTFAYATFVHSDGVPETFVGAVGGILEVQTRMRARARARARRSYNILIPVFPPPPPRR